MAVIPLLLGVLACAPSERNGPARGTDSAEPTTTETMDSASSGPPPLDVPVVTLDPAGPFSVPPLTDQGEYGEAVAVGCDLDHDGVVEWAVSAPGNPNLETRTATVAVYEDRALVHDLRPIDQPGASASNHFRYLGAGGDTDGDGFGELVTNEKWNGFGAYLRLVRSTDPREDLLLVVSDDYVPFPKHVGFVTVDGVDQPYILSSRGAGTWRLDRFDVRGVAPGSTLVGSDATVVFDEAPQDAYEGGEPVAADLDGDGVQELVFGTYASVIEHGTTWVCPTSLGIAVPEDCSTVSLGRSAGRFHEVGDLDGDGDLDIVAVASGVFGDDGEVWFLTAEGETLAHLSGTRGAMLGGDVEYLVDDAGEAWVLVSEFSSSVPFPTRVFRFRVADLVGELTEADAEGSWQTDAAGLGRQTRGYRATPDAPLQLILTEPYHDQGYVYLLPWP